MRTPRSIATSLSLLLSVVGVADVAHAGAKARDTQDDDDGKRARDIEEDAPPEEAPEREPGWIVLNVDGRLGGRFGGSVGNVLLVPFALPGPGAELELRSEVELFRVLYFGLDGGFTLGLDEDGGENLAGYGSMGHAGLRLDLHWVRMQGEAHVGITSLALVPLPRAGLGGRLSLFPVREDWVRWDLTSGLDLDVLLIAPAPSAELSTGVRFQRGRIWGGVRAGVTGSAVVAVLFNSLSGSAFLAVTGGFTID